MLLSAFRAQADFQDVAVCPNQFQTGLAFDAAENDPRATADMDRAVAALVGEPSARSARRTLDETGGASRPDVDFVNLQSLRAFQDAVLDRSANLNLDPSLPGLGFAATGMGAGSGASLLGRAAGPTQLASGPVAAGPAGASNAWARGIGLFGDRDAARCPGTGYTYDLGGAALGADHAFREDLAFGAAFATGDSNSRVKDLSDHLHAFHAHGALYGAWTPGWDRDARLYGAFTSGWIGNDTARSIWTRSFSRLASGGFGSFALSTALEASAIAVEVFEVAIRPKAGLRYFSLGDESYTESDAGALDLVVSSHDVSSLRSELGLQMARRFALGGLRLRARRRPPGPRAGASRRRRAGEDERLAGALGPLPRRHLRGRDRADDPGRRPHRVVTPARAQARLTRASRRACRAPSRRG